MLINFFETFKIYGLPFVLGMIPLVVWMVFFLLRDLKRPEPKKVLLLCFLLGVVATGVTIGANQLLESFSKVNFSHLYNIIKNHDNFNAFLIAAAIEELAKFSLIYFMLRKSRHLDEAIDPMIYMIICAIGFSSVENYLSVFGQVNNIIIPLQTLTARFLGANLLHIICSGAIGFFWSWQIKSRKKYLIPVGLVLAILFHAMFNTLIFTYGAFAVALLFIGVFAGASVLLWLFDTIEDLHVKIKHN